MSEHHTLMYVPISMAPAVQSIMPRPNGQPATHVVVPREPTRAMLDAFHEAEARCAELPEQSCDTVSQINEQLCIAAWPAMLAASEAPGHE